MSLPVRRLWATLALLAAPACVLEYVVFFLAAVGG